MDGDASREFLTALPVALALGAPGWFGMWAWTRSDREADPSGWLSRAPRLTLPAWCWGVALILTSLLLVALVALARALPPVTYLTPSLVMLALPLGACAAAGLNPVPTLGLDGRRVAHFLGLAVLALLAFVPLYFLSGFLVRWVNDAFHLGGEAQDAVQEFLKLTGSDRMAFILLGSVIAPFCEELCFRGFLYPSLKTWMPRWLATFLLSAVFAWLHGSWTAALPLLLLAWLLTELYEVSGSLWPSIVLHGLFNTTTFVLLSYFPQLAEP